MGAPFRNSEFIDFNTGTVFNPPMKVIARLPRPWDLYSKIQVFHCRVDVWHLGPAVQILKEIEGNEPPSAWSHAAYGLLSVIVSYFEMIGKTVNPESKQRGSAGTDFVKGFQDVYQDSGLSEDAVKEFCDRLRNGLYHLGATKSGLWIHNSPAITDKDFDIIPKKDSSGIAVERYYINPHSVVRKVVNHFPTFIGRLKDPDPQYDKMRTKFEEFIDDFHKA
jgi:hypothetical protein